MTTGSIALDCQLFASCSSPHAGRCSNPLPWVNGAGERSGGGGAEELIIMIIIIISSSSSIIIITGVG